jgi:iron complex transport system substrate-binding protein
LAIGKALGKEGEAAEQVDGIKGDFAAAAEEHPEFAGTPAVFLQNAFYDGSAIAYQDGLSTAFLTDLGFGIPKEIDEYAADGQAYIPMENLDVLNNADVLVWGTEADTDRADLEKEALYRNLDPVKNGHLAFTDSTLAGAIYFTSPLSLPYVLDELVPKLATAVEGDPSLAPPSS